LVCRRDVFEKFNGFDEGVTAVEDIEFSLRLSTLSRKVKFMEDTFVLTSTRRAKKWGALKLIKTWPFGYIRLKTLNKSPSYRPVR
jgi:GT2 family glycosyltransferase